MKKIIKIHNPEILNKKSNSLWDCINIDVEYDNGATQLVTMNIEDYKLLEFKNKLIEKGYSEKDLDDLCELAIDHANQENYRNESED